MITLPRLLGKPAIIVYTTSSVMFPPTPNTPNPGPKTLNIEREALNPKAPLTIEVSIPLKSPHNTPIHNALRSLDYVALIADTAVRVHSEEATDFTSEITESNASWAASSEASVRGVGGIALLGADGAEGCWENKFRVSGFRMFRGLGVKGLGV